jgi:integrase
MELLESNQLENLQNQFKIVVEELNLIKKQREEKAALKKAALKKARLERKRLPKRQPITSQIYELLIQSITGKSYQAERLRIAFCLLTVTGIRINELLPLKVYQLEGLIQSHWIGINRSKRGPASNKAFLTPEGKRRVKD